jgi:hypothetical protein
VIELCPAVRFGEVTVPFAVGVPVRCSKPAGHPPTRQGDVWHSGSGRDLDGEVFGTAWRHQLAIEAGS